MIVTFKSPAAGDVIMFGEIAHRLLAVMGKEANAQGIVTVEQLPNAIARLRNAIAEDKAARAAPDAEDPDAKHDGQTGVSLWQRAVPLLELLEWAAKKRKPVTWGV